MKKTLIYLCSLLLLSSCATKKLENTEYSYVFDKSNNTTAVHDTVRLRDSIYITEYCETYVKGDTVYKTDRKTEYIYRDKYRDRTDTIIRTDTIYTERAVEKSEEKRLPLWVSFILIGASIIASLILIKGI